MLTALSVTGEITPRVAIRLAFEAEVLLEELATIKATPAWQRALEQRLSAEMVALLRGVAERVIAELLALGIVPADETVARALTQYIDAMLPTAAEAIDAAVQEAALRGGQAVATSAGMSFDQFPEQTRNLLRDRAFEASERTIQRVTGDVMASLTQSYEDGVGIDEAARRLREVFTDMESYELERVARTEIVSAQNLGTYLTEQLLGVEYHEWIAAQDDRTRESHLEIDGEITRVGEPFSNTLLHPGDTSGPIDEWINCRCRVAAFLMPEGKMPPPGMTQFRESDLIDIVEAA